MPHSPPRFGRTVILAALVLVASLTLPASTASDADGVFGWVIRPGGKILSGPSVSGSYLCTIGFVLRNVSTGELGLLTAGHCVGDLGSAVYVQKNISDRQPDVETSIGHAVALAKCPRLNGYNVEVPTECLNAHFGPMFDIIPATVNDGVMVGNVVVRVTEGFSEGDDFAIIRLTPLAASRADPAFADIGGPCGWTPHPPVPAPIVWRGLPRGAVSLPRAGILWGSGEGSLTAKSAVVPGDSGSGVMIVDEKLALGIFTWGGSGIASTTGGGTTLGYIFSKNPGWRLEVDPQCAGQ